MPKKKVAGLDGNRWSGFARDCWTASQTGAAHQVSINHLPGYIPTNILLLLLLFVCVWQCPSAGTQTARSVCGGQRTTFEVGYLLLPWVPGTRPRESGLHSRCLYLFSHLAPLPNTTRHWLCFPLSHFDRLIMILNVSSFFCSPTSYSFHHFPSLGNTHRHIQKRASQLSGHSSTQHGRQDYLPLGHCRFRGKGPLAAF